jgi:hypothetical protein
MQSPTLMLVNDRAKAPVTAVAMGATRLLSRTGQWQSVAVAFWDSEDSKLSRSENVTRGRILGRTKSFNDGAGSQ